MRADFWDYWKGIAIVAVVLIHANVSIALFPDNSFNWYFGIALRQVLNFCVPLFFTISGYLASIKPSKAYSINYFYNRFKRILIPYLIWTFVFILIRKPSHLLSPTHLIKSIILGKGIDIGYFVVVLVQLTVLTPVIIKLQSKWLQKVLIVSSFIFSMIYTYIVRIRFHDSTFANFPMYALFFFIWYPFYHFGIYLGKYQDFCIIRNRSSFYISYIFLISVSVLEGIILAQNGFLSFGTSQIKLTSFLASMLLITIIFSYSNQKVCFFNKPLTWLGKYSFFIYLTHLLFLPRITEILNNNAFIYATQPIFIVLISSLTLALCFLTITVIKSIIPKYYQKHLGI